MENTLNLLLQDTQARWFSVSNGQPVGPLSSKEIVLRIQSGALSFGSYVWRQGLSDWKRIYEMEDFQCLLPTQPPSDLIQQLQALLKATVVPPPVKPKEEARIWYVHVDNTQYGPFSVAELATLIDSNRVTEGTYVWKQGFTEWSLASKVSELATYWKKPSVSPADQQKLDKRKAPRKPFEARIILTDGKEIGWAVCRDISVGGMQVLMDQNPGVIGTSLKINVSGAGDILSFACEGVVVRILEDNRGFSCRFTNISDEARASIEKYIQL